KLGDYYNRHKQYKGLLTELIDNSNAGNLVYLNNYLFDINLSNYPQDSNIYIGIGEKDYHKKKHTTTILEWLKHNNIKVNYEEYEGFNYQDTKKLIEKNLSRLI